MTHEELLQRASNRTGEWHTQKCKKCGVYFDSIGRQADFCLSCCSYEALLLLRKTVKMIDDRTIKCDAEKIISASRAWI